MFSLIKNITTLFKRKETHTTCNHIFVYGTLRSEYTDKIHLTKKLHKCTELIDSNILLNYELRVVKDSTGSAMYPIAIPSNTNKIYGQILKFKSEFKEQLLNDLDSYEGCMYERKTIKISGLCCYVYIAIKHERYLKNELIVDGDWVGYVNLNSHSFIKMYNQI